LAGAHGNPNVPLLHEPGTPWQFLSSNNHDDWEPILPQQDLSPYGHPTETPQPEISVTESSPSLSRLPDWDALSLASSVTRAYSAIVSKEDQPRLEPLDSRRIQWSVLALPILTIILAVVLAWWSPFQSVPDVVLAEEDFAPIVALPPLKSWTLDSLREDLSMSERRFPQIQRWDADLVNTSSPIAQIATNPSSANTARLSKLVAAARFYNDMACSIMKTRSTPLMDHAIQNFALAHDFAWHAASVANPFEDTKLGQPLAMVIYLHAVRQLLINSTMSPQLWPLSEMLQAKQAEVEVAKLAHVTLGMYNLVLSLRTDLENHTISNLALNIKANLVDLRPIRTVHANGKILAFFKSGPETSTAELCTLNCWSDSWITSPWTFALFSDQKDDCRDRFEF
jgi:hypothetical protein